MNRDQIAILRKQLEGLVPDERSSGHWQLGFYVGRDAAAKLLLDLAVRGLEAEAYRRLLSEIVKRFPQREQMLPFVRQAVEVLKSECSNCGEVTLPWEGHAPCNAVLPVLRAERDAAVAERDRLRKVVLDYYYCTGDSLDNLINAGAVEARRIAQGDAKRPVTRLQKGGE